jgi:pectate lyase
MKHMVFLVGIFSILVSCGSEPAGIVEDVQLAFPGAEGFGKFTTGGRSAKVLIVENLNDAGPGSLRDAIDQKYPRTIVFNVSGNIALKSPLNIRSGDLTIAGQSAPGDGICLKHYPLFVKASNVIIRYIRVRMGDAYGQQADCIGIVRQKDVIIDHCSFSWATDEVASAYDNENFTMQWCMITESLNRSIHQKGEHGYGGIWGGKGASFHHNLLAHHKSRLPRFCGARYHKEPKREVVDFRNNVIYNWKSNSSYAGEEGRHNVVNNYYRAGPATDASKRDRILNPWSPYGAFYVDGNVLHGNAAVTGDNWKGVHTDDVEPCKAKDEIAVEGIAHQSARDAFVQVLAGAGASHSRDEIDQRIVREVEQGTAQYGVKGDGIIDSQDQVGSWPELTIYHLVEDEDKDGMSDEWEASKGLDPEDSEDHAAFDLDDHYTNLEVYLNELISTK